MNINKKVLSLITKVNTRLHRGQLWIVGGYVRDLLLDKLTKDIDFVTGGNTKNIAKTFAAANNGSFVVLDDFFKIYRVIIGDEIYDFSKMQGRNITEDLARRDFTINAMALPVTGSRFPAAASVIDPFHGQADIKNKIIRSISENNLLEDPLRLLRAYRFAGQLNFKIEQKTEKSIRKYSKYLKNVSFERIQYELFLILELKDSYSVVKKIYKTGLLKEIIPELVSTRNTARCYYPKMGLLGHSFDTLKILEQFYNTNFKNISAKHSKQISTHLEEKISKTVKRKTLLKLAALLHDIGKPKSAKKIEGRLRFFQHEERGAEIIDSVGKHLKLSNSKMAYLKKLTRQHMRLGNLTSAEKVTDKAVWRFFRDLESDLIDVIILSVSDAFTYPHGKTRTLHKTVANKLLNGFYRRKEKIIPEKLINGNDVMKILKIPAGPLVGKILKELEEAQALKKIKTKNEAESFIKRFTKSNKIV